MDSLLRHNTGGSYVRYDHDGICDDSLHFASRDNRSSISHKDTDKRVAEEGRSNFQNNENDHDAIDMNEINSSTPLTSIAASSSARIMSTRTKNVSRAIGQQWNDEWSESVDSVNPRHKKMFQFLVYFRILHAFSMP